MRVKKRVGKLNSQLGGGGLAWWAGNTKNVPPLKVKKFHKLSQGLTIFELRSTNEATTTTTTTTAAATTTTTTMTTNDHDDDDGDDDKVDDSYSNNNKHKSNIDCPRTKKENYICVRNLL